MLLETGLTIERTDEICRAAEIMTSQMKTMCDNDTAVPQLLYEQLGHIDTRHFVILECRHLTNGCVLKCGCIGLMLFRNLSCLGTIYTTKGDACVCKI